MARFATVGAGLAGISLAHNLKCAGYDCTVFEKSHEVGGRLATRHLEDWQADFGTQYFTARSPQFISEVSSWLDKEWAVPWHLTPWLLQRDSCLPSPDDQIRYVGTPAMNRMVKELEKGLDCYLDTRIDRLEYQNAQWRLWDSQGEHYGMFDAVVLTAPLAQSLALLPSSFPAEATIRTAKMSPTWVYALALEQESNIEPDALFSDDGIVSWAARNSSKPGRDSQFETWVLHFSPQWTANHLDASEELLRHQAVQFLSLLAGRDIGRLHDAFHYRWLYARASAKEITIPQWDAQMRIGLAGDWTMGSRLEDAWLSAQYVANQLIDTFTDKSQ